MLYEVITQIPGAWADMVPVTITSLDPRFDQLVPIGAKLEKIAEGFTWTEGPVWHKRDGYRNNFV